MTASQRPPASTSPEAGGRALHLSEAGDDGARFTLFRELRDPPVIARFTVDGEPVSKARARFTKRGSKIRTYTPEKTHEAEQAMGWAFRKVAPNHALDPEATYGVVALFFSATRQRRDVDNMLKLVLDGLNKVAWPDDDQVVEVSGRKSLVLDPEDARTEVVVYRIGMVERRMGACEQCGQSFPIYRSQRGRRFCSSACNYAWRRERRSRNCEHCGESFTPAKVQASIKYCSRACAYAAKRATVTCTQCGVEFTKQRCHVREKNYCSPDCRNRHARQARAAAARGNCETCGGPTSKKSYKQCRACRLGDAPTGGRPTHITELEVPRGH